MKLKEIFKELQRRHVVKAGIAYLVAAWLIVQVATILLPLFKISESVSQTIVIILAVGFPIWLIIAWVYDFSPDGIKKTEDIPFDAAASKKKNVSLNRFIIGGLSIAVILLIANTFRLTNKIEFEEDGRLTIAVLPFDNFSPDEKNEWIGDGVTEDLLTQLQKIDTFRVISRTSVMRYKKIKKSIPEIARELGASYLVEGSVRVAGDDILITAQLVDKYDMHLWADKYREKGGDVFDLQDQVARDVTENLLGELTPVQENKLQKTIEIDPEARKYMVWGNRIFDAMNINAQPEAYEYYKKAIKIEPQWVEPIAALAYWTTYNDYILGDSLAKKALSLDPLSDQANAASAVASSYLTNPREVLNQLENYVINNPNSPWSLDVLAVAYSEPGSPYDPKKAFDYASKAVKLDPNSQIFARNQIIALLEQEEFEKADSILKLKDPILSKGIKASLNSIKTWESALFKSRQERNYNEGLKIMLDQGNYNKDNQATYFLNLARYYAYYFNDHQNALKYAKAAWESRDNLIETDNSNLPQIILAYSWSLIENKQFAAAKDFLSSKEVQKVYNESTIHALEIDNSWFWYYIEIEDFNSASKYIKRGPYLELIYYAAKGDKSKAYHLMNSGVSISDKAEAFALLGIQDSLFHYLQKDEIDIRWINSQSIFNPYRKDPRFIAFRKKHFLEDVSIE